MKRYLIRRLVLFLPTLLVASLVVFGIMRALPGDVVGVVLGGTGQTAVSEEQLDAIREELGLKDPLPVQYGRWLLSMVNGQFGGRSLETREPIRSLVARQLPVTALLTFYAIGLAVLLSVPLGILAAIRQNGWPDYLIRIAAIAGNAMPSFWVGLMALLGLVIVFQWSPPVIYRDIWENPWEHLQIMLIPALALGWQYSAHVTRVTRSSALEILRQDFIRTARAKGLPERLVVSGHVVRNALIPVITVASLQLGAVLSGAIILESIFGLPGLGRGVVSAVTARDYPVIQSLAMLLVFLILGVNLVVDIVYGLIDPRISYADQR